MSSPWPSLPYDAWKDTHATLHLWTQIVGKIPLARSPWLNHSWHVTYFVTARGLATRLIPHDTESLQIEFDFVQHRLWVRTTSGGTGSVPLVAQSVAAFYRQFMAALGELGVPVAITPLPCEVPDPVTPFHDDETNCSYDREYVARYWQILVRANRLFEEFRSRFVGKSSPVHFFWGAPDLALTRFSGRRAPEHPGRVPHMPRWVLREAYSQEVSSLGFWAGGPSFPQPMFYSYAYPEPAGFASARVRPEEARYVAELGEFALPYEELRRRADADDALLDFAQSTYECAAELARWNRAELESGRGLHRS